MAGTMRVVLNHAGVRQLLQGGEIAGFLGSRAAAIASAAGDGFESDVSIGATRARAMVWTATFDARLAEATGRVLTGAIDAGRG